VKQNVLYWPILFEIPFEVEIRRPSSRMVSGQRRSWRTWRRETTHQCSVSWGNPHGHSAWTVLVWGSPHWCCGGVRRRDGKMLNISMLGISTSSHAVGLPMDLEVRNKFYSLRIPLELFALPTWAWLEWLNPHLKSLGSDLSLKWSCGCTFKCQSDSSEVSSESKWCKLSKWSVVFLMRTVTVVRSTVHHHLKFARTDEKPVWTGLSVHKFRCRYRQILAFNEPKIVNFSEKLENVMSKSVNFEPISHSRKTRVNRMVLSTCIPSLWVIYLYFVLKNIYETSWDRFRPVVNRSRSEPVRTSLVTAKNWKR